MDVAGLQKKRREKGKSVLTRAHTGWWRLQENKTKDKYATRLTIYTKRKACVKREADRGSIM